MNKKTLMVAGGVGVVMLAVGVGFIVPKIRQVNPSADTQVVSTGDVTIKMTADGFSPDTIKIKRGTKVTFANNDTLGHWPASDLHPSHTIYPEFDPKRVMAPKEEWSFVFEKTGEWGMHDHLAPYMIGTITVVE